MNNNKFDELWTVISNAAEDIQNACKDQTHFNSQKKLYVLYEYNKLRDDCKKQHFDAEEPEDYEDILLDRHKVAACIAGAILSAKPLDAPPVPKKGRYKMSYFANETLALFSALGIVKSFIESDKENKIKLDGEQKSDFSKNGFIFPKSAHDDYIIWLIFLLHESSKIGFNVLSFSNILYLLETYTFSQIEIKLLKQK